MLKIISFNINPEKIGDVIGKQGKVIQSIQEQCDCTINIEEDGRVFVSGLDIEKAKQAVSIIELIANDPEIGAIYSGLLKSCPLLGIRLNELSLLFIR